MWKTVLTISIIVMQAAVQVINTLEKRRRA